MDPSEVSPAVAAFITDHVRSLDELQLLMAIMQSGERWWDASSAARESGLPVPAARAVLDRFAARNLLDIRITDDVRYQFSPGTPALRDTARMAAEVYRKRPLAVARLVPREPRRGITDFADAFRIRRDEDG